MLKAPRGTMDILPKNAARWHFLEDTFKKICYSYGYQEIRTPIIEQTELFQRGVGESTDVIEKEMYSFQDRGGRSISLRPEGTAPVARAYIEHKMYNLPQPVKMYYYGPMFRYDRPQAGRYRQFYQLGVEALGAADPAIDAEVIMLAREFFLEIGLDDLVLQLNSVGCPECRLSYREKLVSFFQQHEQSLCSDCQRRLMQNPLRLLDCKKEKCGFIAQKAPVIKDHLCLSCREHFDSLLHSLDALKVPYELNTQLVRGLDYYTKTAFEFIEGSHKSQNSLGGGGRYDCLVETYGGPATPGIGVALGVERILMALESKNIEEKLPENAGIFVAVAEHSLSNIRWELVYALRRKGFYVDTDFLGHRSLRSQLKTANKKGFPYLIIIGPDEVKRGNITLRNMKSGSQEEVSMEKLSVYLSSLMGERPEEGC